MHIEDLPGEEWRDAPGFPDYQVSSHGRVKSFRKDPRGRLMELQPQLNYRTRSRSDVCGLTVTLATAPRRPRCVSVARLVALAFLDVPDDHERLVVRHLDHDTQNNRVENLFWDQRGRRRLDV